MAQDHQIPDAEALIDPEMLERIDSDRANPPAGIPHDDILREFGL